MRVNTIAVVEQEAVDASFDALYQTYYGPIYRYLLSLVSSSMQAEDLTQEVFVRALRALPRLSPESNMSAWLYRVARNIAIDVLRRRRLIDWSSLEEEISERESMEYRDPQVRYDGSSEEVLLALERMPQALREALVLYELEGASYAQVAQQIQSATSGVKMCLTRARKKFKQHYQDVRNEVLA